VAEVDGKQSLISRTHHVMRRISKFVIASLLYDNIAGYVLLFIMCSNTSLIFAEKIFTILEQKFDD